MALPGYYEPKRSLLLKTNEQYVISKLGERDFNLFNVAPVYIGNFDR